MLFDWNVLFLLMVSESAEDCDEDNCSLPDNMDSKDDEDDECRPVLQVCFVVFSWCLYVFWIKYSCIRNIFNCISRWMWWNPVKGQVGHKCGVIVLCIHHSRWTSCLLWFLNILWCSNEWTLRDLCPVTCACLSMLSLEVCRWTLLNCFQRLSGC